MNALTAAHRTLPLGSIVRVTNLKTGNSTLVRVTDRGPFIPGRILDLSLAAAKAIDVWKAGLATVKVEVMQTPSPLNPLGAKGVGEGGAIAAPPVLVNATLDALAPLGVHHLDMPLHPHKVWEAIRQAKGE